MEALKAILTRRSVRDYQEKRIPASIIKQLIKAGASAPSSFNDQPWVFVTVTKKETMNQLVSIKSQTSKFISKAPLIIACCYDQNKSHTKQHNLENVAVAAENILIAVNALGLGACYVTAFDENYPEIKQSIIKELKLPKNIKPVCLISIGYPASKPKNKKLRPISEVWQKEHYGSNKSN